MPRAALSYFALPQVKLESTRIVDHTVFGVSIWTFLMGSRAGYFPNESPGKVLILEPGSLAASYNLFLRQ